MWQFILGFGAGVYVGTNYDCKPTIKFIQNCIKIMFQMIWSPKKRKKR